MPRRSPLNPDDTLTITPSVVKVLRRLIEGDHDDRSPSTRDIKRAMADANCDENDRDVVLYILELHEEL